MSDIALVWNDTAYAADLAMDGGQLAMDQGLRTAIILSLFTDARASAEDDLPEENADRRGWWGNAFPASEGDRPRELGSKLWLLDRAKTLSDVPVRARQYAQEALQWMLDDKILSSLEVIAERQRRDGTDVVAIGITITRPNGPSRQRFDFLLEASA